MFYGDLIMKKYLINYLRENGKMLKAIATFIIIGIIVGIVIYFIIPSQIKKEMIELCKRTLDISKQGNFNKLNIILNGCISGFIILFIIYLTSFLIMRSTNYFIYWKYKGDSNWIFISYVN